MEFYKKAAVKGPLNYAGGKFSLLEQIFPYFPKKVDVFWDIFAGGWNVGINVNADTIIFNDINKPLIDMLNALMCHSLSDILFRINELCDTYNLVSAGMKMDADARRLNNRAGFEALKKHYNTVGNPMYRDPIVLYVLMGFAYQNQIRINAKGDFKSDVGTGLSMALEEKLVEFVTELHNKHDRILTSNLPFQEIDLDNPSVQGCFLYVDPPYLITNASYNKLWNERTERELLDFLDRADANGLQFALSNLLSREIKRENDTDFTFVENKILAQWLQDNKHRYRVHYLNHSYQNIARTANTALRNEKEILVTNYDPNVQEPLKYPSQIPHPMGVGYVRVPSPNWSLMYVSPKAKK